MYYEGYEKLTITPYLLELYSFVNKDMQFQQKFAYLFYFL